MLVSLVNIFNNVDANEHERNDARREGKSNTLVSKVNKMNTNVYMIRRISLVDNMPSHRLVNTLEKK